MEKLNRAQKCSILGPQNLGSGGGARAPGAPPGSAPDEVINRVFSLKLYKFAQCFTMYVTLLVLLNPPKSSNCFQ